MSSISQEDASGTSSGGSKRASAGLTTSTYTSNTNNTNNTNNINNNGDNDTDQKYDNDNLGIEVQQLQTYDPKDPNRPRFTLVEMQKVLVEKNKLTIKLDQTQDELEQMRKQWVFVCCL